MFLNLFIFVKYYWVQSQPGLTNYFFKKFLFYFYLKHCYSTYRKIKITYNIKKLIFTVHSHTTYLILSQILRLCQKIIQKYILVYFTEIITRHIFNQIRIRLSSPSLFHFYFLNLQTLKFSQLTFMSNVFDR